MSDDHEQEGEHGLEGSIGLESGELVGSNASTKRQKSMLELLELHDKRIKSPDFDPKLEKSIHKLDEFAPSPTRYARRQRFTLTVKRGTQVQTKKVLTGYTLVEHTDLFDMHDGQRRVHVQSDKTSVIIIGHYIDQKNVIGRQARKAGVKPITSLADTLEDLLSVSGLGESLSKDSE